MQKNNGNGLETKSFMLGKEEINTIEYVNNLHGLGSASASLRIIIRQWAEANSNTVKIPIIGTIKGDKIIFKKGE